MLLNTDRVCFCLAILNLNLLTFMPKVYIYIYVCVCVCVYIYMKKLSIGHKLKKELHSMLLTQQEDLRKFWVTVV